MTKKKVLVTGFNNEQTRYDGYLRKRVGVILCHYGLVRCLEDMDFELTQTYTEPGTDISEYDHVIVFLHNPQGFCQRLFDGLWALSQRPDAILAFDDWQVKDIYNGIIQYGKTVRERPSSAYRTHILDQYATIKDKEKVMSFNSAYLDAIDMLKEKKNKVLLCTYKGGDVEKFGLDWNKNLLYTFNPNPYHLSRSFLNNFGMPEEIEGANLRAFFDDTDANIPDKANKEKAWIFSSLVQTKTRKWLDKMDMEWDVRIYGAQRGAYKSERLTEDKMVQEYQNVWGNLMPAYDNIGSGWWRTRVLQCAEAKCITYCDPEEGKIYGEEFCNFTPADLEAMDTDQLWQKAMDQYTCLLTNHPLNTNITREEISEVLYG